LIVECWCYECKPFSDGLWAAATNNMSGDDMLCVYVNSLGRRAGISQQMNASTGNDTHTFRMTADVTTMLSILAGVETVWSSFICGVHWRKKK